MFYTMTQWKRHSVLVGSIVLSKVSAKESRPSDFLLGRRAAIDRSRTGQSRRFDQHIMRHQRSTWQSKLTGKRCEKLLDRAVPDRFGRFLSTSCDILKGGLHRASNGFSAWLKRIFYAVESCCGWNHCRPLGIGQRTCHAPYRDLTGAVVLGSCLDAHMTRSAKFGR